MIKNLSYIFFVLIMLSCGSETKKNLVTDIKKEGQDNSTEIYKTEYFKVDLTITGYKHALTKNGLFTFNEDGNYESVNNVSNTIVIGRLPKMSEIEKKEFIENLKPKGEHQLEDIKDSEIVTTKIGDYSA